MNFTESKELKNKLENKCEEFSNVLRSFSGDKNTIGLLPDSVRLTPEYRFARKQYDEAFKALRSFNSIFVKKFKKELAQERKDKLANIL